MSPSLALSMAIIGILVPGMSTGDNCIGCSNCCNVNCVSGDMQIEERTKGTVRVSQLSSGDIIRGIMDASRTLGWCKVEAVYRRAPSENVTTYDGFTVDHMVVDADTVRPHGDKGQAKKTPIYTLATECDAAVNSAGRAFTPISTSFCPHELSWGEYLSLIAAIRRVTDRTGYFWYMDDAFYDNETAKVQYWADVLPDLCTELLRCAREEKCQKFEKLVEEFVHEHLNPKYLVVVDRVFPNMGGDVEKSEAGTVTEIVRPQKESHTVLFLGVGSATAGLLMIVAAAVFMYRIRATRKKKVGATQVSDPTDHPGAKSQDVEA